MARRIIIIHILIDYISMDHTFDSTTHIDLFSATEGEINELSLTDAGCDLILREKDAIEACIYKFIDKRAEDVRKLVDSSFVEPCGLNGDDIDYIAKAVSDSYYSSMPKVLPFHDQEISFARALRLGNSDAVHASIKMINGFLPMLCDVDKDSKNQILGIMTILTDNGISKRISDRLSIGDNEVLNAFYLLKIHLGIDSNSGRSAQE